MQKTGLVFRKEAVRHQKHHHITLTTGPAAPAADAAPGPDPPPELSNLGKKSAQYYRCAGEPVVQLLASQLNMQSTKVQFGSKHSCWFFHVAKIHLFELVIQKRA